MVTTHTDKAYEAELKDLRDKLLEMGGLVERAMAASVRSITERDTPLAEQVKERDREINRMEVAIDSACRRVLALRQPAASDLRFITTALKIVTDLERMGDLAVNVAERAIDLNKVAPLGPLHDLSRLAEMSETQLKHALDAFVTGDVAKAEDVMRSDEHLDALYLKIFNDLLAMMMEDSRNIRRATSLMFAAKHLERFGDHATNLAEMVVYMVRGTDVRHPRSRAPSAPPA
ncbi:phosphate signaling complex protein PhoU [Anaeromyxobacter sp. Fw109-5]|uniref:phosphate signaling complex protein PhoU n=1 Tax=Anaeromyxobacter sp. (strain Fw109-5) TaxID=404589 RepID=UPI0000ED79D5|nr:phosphate signaling complex protein PhoU [Anaeromyxobacter sp. Fw109-5]ABS24637.1 phosphate uptake regulator, PhoU [Anaeromyxobacter sp. Fw109-5]